MPMFAMNACSHNKQGQWQEPFPCLSGFCGTQRSSRMQYPGKITAALESVAVITHHSGDAA